MHMKKTILSEEMKALFSDFKNSRKAYGECLDKLLTAGSAE